MKRTQLYLPQDVYESAKIEADRRNISFAELVRIYLAESLPDQGKNKKVIDRFPFLQHSFSFQKKDLDNSVIDKTLYGGLL